MQDESCYLCGHITEDILHVLRNRSYAKEIWHQVIPPNHIRRFFAGNISNWLISNLQVNKANNLSDSDWTCFFGIILWHIWKNRNLYIFQGKAMNSKEVIRVLYCWAKHFTSIHNKALKINTWLI
ncbi:hypothetical protein PVK06_013144 [Gossypium arboreum]|uniref:Uncharacterized protein n=1 Tax=Gossypium arboreum TaxID=29729 RepID=A0ABR0QE77_GOSAR|nr:hypothetical protein PVK06_013144 [Gossypium arboreum]